MATQIAQSLGGGDVPSFTELEADQNYVTYYHENDKRSTILMVPPSWAAPPTPQESLASYSAPPSPPQARAQLCLQQPPQTPLCAPETVLLGRGTAAVLAATATLATPATPEQTPGQTPEQTPKQTRDYRMLRVRNSSIGSHHGRDSRMQQWLTDIPPPVSPHERYLQGLNPKADHPLHPKPLELPAGRQSRLGSTSMGTDEADAATTTAATTVTTATTITSKERASEHSSHPTEAVDKDAEGKKRHMPEEHPEALLRKRIRLFDPVRRFSQKVSSLSLSTMDPDDSRLQLSGSASSEDTVRRSEQLYRFAQGEDHVSHKNSLRMSLSKHSGSLRVSGSVTLRRMMQKHAAAAAVAPAVLGSMETWTEGRADMIVNVALIGDAYVGKSALLRRLMDRPFEDAYVPSEIQEQGLQLKVGESRVQLNVSEAGSARNQRQPSLLALGWFSVVVLCFDIGCHSSLANLERYRNEIAMYEENAVVVLVGLKKDARHWLPPLHLTFVQDAAQVSTEEGQAAAARLHCSEYFECSSMGSCEGVKDFFDYVVRSGVELQRQRDKKMARFRLEHSMDKSMTRIAEGVRSLFLPGRSSSG